MTFIELAVEHFIEAISKEKNTIELSNGKLRMSE